MAQLTSLRIHPVKSFRAIALDEATVEPWGLAEDRRWMVVDETGEVLTQREDPRLALFEARIEADGTLFVDHPDAAAPLCVAVPGAPEESLAAVSIFGHGFDAPVAPSPEAGAWFRKLLDRELRVVHLDEPQRRPRPATTSLADAYPLLLTTVPSLTALDALIAQDHPEAAAAGPVPMDRFRPNLVLDATAADGADLTPWAETGWRRIAIGALEFEVVQQCGRCVMTTVDQDGGHFTGQQPLRTLRKRRRFGKSAGFGMHLVPLAPYGTLRLGDELRVLEAGPLPQPD